MVEFHTKVYPERYRKKHSSIHSIYLDMDGVLWERERADECRPWFEKIASYLKACKGPFTDSPPISIATGAYKNSLFDALRYVPIDKHHIPSQFHRTSPPLLWPPIIFEEGYLVFDPVNGTFYDLTEEKYGMVSQDTRELLKIIRDIGRKVDKKVPQINQDLGAECQKTRKEKAGYTLDLPYGLRLNPEAVRKAHCLIFARVADILEKNLSEGIEIEFDGLLNKEELEKGRKKR